MRWDFCLDHEVGAGDAENVTQDVWVKNQSIHKNTLWSMHDRDNKRHPLMSQKSPAD